VRALSQNRGERHSNKEQKIVNLEDQELGLRIIYTQVMPLLFKIKILSGLRHNSMTGGSKNVLKMSKT
jgi:hypothetical protein